MNLHCPCGIIVVNSVGRLQTEVPPITGLVLVSRDSTENTKLSVVVFFVVFLCVSLYFYIS